MEMTSRERVLTACRRQQPDRVPRNIWLEWHVVRKFQEHFGVQDHESILRNDMRGVDPLPTSLKNDYSRYFTREGVTWDEWGRGRIWDKEEIYAEYVYPLANAESVDEAVSYPWPDLDAPYRFEGIGERTKALQDQGFAVRAGMEETIFEIAWQLRSIERLSEDMLLGDEIGQIVLDRITDCRVYAAREYAKAGVDILALGDDVAMQTGLMLSRKLYNKQLRPRMERIINAAREIKPDIFIHYHSDGKINDLIPDLIDEGVDVLNPVQPECVDHAWIKDAYGDRLAFSGGLGVQSVLPFGTTEEVREHVRRTIATLGRNGGLLIGPSHIVESDVPIANIQAMIEAIDEFGVY
jgi:uroporphyrinogen decarboxylase